MKKIFLILILMLFGMSCVAETLQAGISIDKIPETLYGCWRVVAKIDKEKGSVYFKPNSIDFWNLSRQGDVINLTNPFTGASASVTVDYVEGEMIRFTKVSNDGNKKLTDTVDLKINGDYFTGINHIKLESFSVNDNTLFKTDSAIYILKGEKIFGTNIVEK